MSLLEEGKANTHLTHLEELVLTQGPKGYDMARAFLLELLETLKGNSRSHVQTSVKWDGAPAIFAGVNPENGKFFVGTKSIFNKAPKINYTPEDILDNHGHAPGLVDKLTKALKYLPSLGIKKILQGDFMFDDEMLDVVEIGGEPHYRFKPNTIVYAAPVDSDLGREIGKSKFGIVFHTTYDSLDSGASFGADVSGLRRVPGIWFDDAFFTDDTGTVTLTAGEEERVINLVAKADQVNKKINYNDLPSDLLNIYINSEIRGGEFLEDPEKSFQGFLNWYSTKLEKKLDNLKSEKGRMRAFNKGEEDLQAFQNKQEDILNLFRVSRLLFEAKNIFIAKYNNAVYNTKHFIDDGSGDLVATNPEGYVAVDHEGNGVKFVDRLEFSRANFMIDKGDKFAQNESLTVYWGSDGFSVTKTLDEWASNLPPTTKTNKRLFTRLQSGTPITAMIPQARHVKQALAEAVNWALRKQPTKESLLSWAEGLTYTETPLTEGNSSDTVLYLPGGFKPPHKGHFALARDALSQYPGAQLVIMSGESPRGNITLDKARNVWDIYFKSIGEEGNVEVRALQPEYPRDADGNRMRKYVRGAGVRNPMPYLEWKEINLKGSGIAEEDMKALYARAVGVPKSGKKSAVLDNDGNPITVEFMTTSPINSIASAIRFKDKPKHAIIVASGEDPENATSLAQSLQNQGLPVDSLIVPVRVKDKAGTAKMSATNMRRAIEHGFEEFVQFLPDELNDQQMQEVFAILGGALDETSGSGSGPGLAGSPGKVLNVYPDRAPTVPGSEPRRRRRKPGEFVEEQLVNEVVDYLLGISVG